MLVELEMEKVVRGKCLAASKPYDEFLSLDCEKNLRVFDLLLNERTFEQIVFMERGVLADSRPARYVRGAMGTHGKPIKRHDIFLLIGSCVPSDPPSSFFLQVAEVSHA